MDPGHWIQAAFKIKGYYIVANFYFVCCSSMAIWVIAMMVEHCSIAFPLILLPPPSLYISPPGDQPS